MILIENKIKFSRGLNLYHFEYILIQDRGILIAYDPESKANAFRPGKKRAATDGIFVVKWGSQCIIAVFQTNEITG